MEGECIGVKALQGYYPPRLVFNIRLKNNSGYHWSIIGYGGHVIATDERIDIGTIETVFCRLSIAQMENIAFQQRWNIIRSWI